jgi:putative transposase
LLNSEDVPNVVENGLKSHAVGITVMVVNKSLPRFIGDRMMARSYKKKTNRSKRKQIQLNKQAVTVSLADGQAQFQMVLPMSEALWDVAAAVEQSATQAGLMMIKALVDEEVEQLAGDRYDHDRDRHAVRWGRQDGHVVFAGRKVAMEKPRVRTADGRCELPLSRWAAFAHPHRMQQAVQNKILRRVSCRDYEGVIDDVCDGYGIDKSSVSRHWQAASAKQLAAMMERRLDDLDLCVMMLDGKDFHDYTLITALGVDSLGRKHVLGLWPGATENSEVCGALLDDLMERGLSRQKRLLFVIDGSKALRKAIRDRFGTSVLIQRCRLHKERNIRRYLPRKHHRLLTMKLKAAFGMTDHAEAIRELRQVQDWLGSINDAAAKSLQEGFEELLTVTKLQLPPSLTKIFASTNLIESGFSIADDLCRNVKHWRNANMAWRWGGTVLLEAEKRFHRIRGYRELPLLLNTLEQLVDSKEAVA